MFPGQPLESQRAEETLLRTRVHVAHWERGVNIHKRRGDNEAQVKTMSNHTHTGSQDTEEKHKQEEKEPK